MKRGFIGGGAAQVPPAKVTKVDGNDRSGLDDTHAQEGDLLSRLLPDSIITVRVNTGNGLNHKCHLVMALTHAHEQEITLLMDDLAIERSRLTCRCLHGWDMSINIQSSTNCTSSDFAYLCLACNQGLGG